MMRLIQLDVHNAPDHYDFWQNVDDAAQDAVDDGWEIIGRYEMVQRQPPESALRQAAVQFNAALQLQPDLIDAYVGLGYVQSRRGRWAAARKEFARGVAIGQQAIPPAWSGRLIWGSLRNRPFLRGLHGLGLAYMHTGHPEAAAAIYRWGLSLDPYDAIGFEVLLKDLAEKAKA